jgi:multidrug efflux pump subunit AcrA (membrane-fusion protein)
MAGQIFINYRRDDAIGTAGRLHDRLAQTFGRNNLFMDVDHIPAGVDFVEYLHSQVAACDVFLAIIGPNWLNAKDGSGRRRFDNPDDFVTIEIAAALARNIRVIPVLVDGARTPKADKLPDSVKPLVRRHAVEVWNTHFGRDAEALANKVRQALKARPVTGHWPFLASAAAWLMAPGRWRAVAGSATALLLVGWIGLYQLGVPVWVPWTPNGGQPDGSGADKGQRKAEEAVRQRPDSVKADEERKAPEGEPLGARIPAVVAVLSKADGEREKAAAAEAEAQRKAAEEAERQRLAAVKGDEERKAKAAAEAEVKKAAAEAEARAKAEQAEKERLAAAAVKADEERKAKAAAEAEAKRKSEEAEQQRLAALKAEEERRKQAEAEARARYSALVSEGNTAESRSFTVDLTEFHGRQKSYQIRGNMTIQAFLNDLYFEINKTAKMARFQYGKRWILEDVQSGMPFRDIGGGTDNRPLTELKITPGSTLKVRKLK